MMVWDLVDGKGRECSEGGLDSGHTEIHQQAPIISGTVGGPPAHTQSLSVGYGVQGRGAEKSSMLAEDGDRCPTEGYTKRDLGICMVIGATEIWQA